MKKFLTQLSCNTRLCLQSIRTRGAQKLQAARKYIKTQIGTPYNDCKKKGDEDRFQIKSVAATYAESSD